MLRLARSCKIDFLICSESVNSSQPGHSRALEPVEAPRGRQRERTFFWKACFPKEVFSFVLFLRQTGRWSKSRSRVWKAQNSGHTRSPLGISKKEQPWRLRSCTIPPSFRNHDWSLGQELYCTVFAFCLQINLRKQLLKSESLKQKI